ncbi:hypothetical protein D6851_04230 [Altericroceibacterium spongiae]|uniref:Transferrin-binding protein B C-lobe/N-lobe beta-barrel domain-containing protein n=1 Tax=Altericroceibacterium spongiae TaxID=2320269 RepID=A0A420EP43_9SPHN|nr:transferrin-binding protein-like solute binding protein [Altericroceibacterium spongiae]RKF22443.1 hypothetical protein D6851_04230 [Altericroceibacterium spongiae]
MEIYRFGQASFARGTAMATAIALGLAVAACGGDNDRPGSIPPPPNPAPSPSPSPTPTPGTGSNPDLIDLEESETFAVSGSQIVAGQDVIITPKPFGTMTLAYDAEADSYTITDGDRSVTFADSTRSDELEAAGYTLYDIDRGPDDFDTLILLNPGSDEVVDLTYTSYGIWQQGSNAGAEFNFFVGGVETATADMPRTGSASYTGAADGLAVVDGTTYQLLGSTGTLTADFGTGAVETSLTLRGNANPDEANFMVPGTTDLGTLTGSGTIGADSNRYSGTLSGAGMSGDLDGAFFGPSATETGYSFQVQGGGDQAAGVFVGAKD